MNRKIKLGLVAVMLLLFAGIASAGDLPPPIPADYSGNVIVNGAPNGSKVLAQVVNVTGYVYQTSIFDIVSGRYGKPVNGNPLLVAPPDVTFNDKIIKFYVKTDGKYCKANQEDTFSQGKTGDPFNLTVVVSPCVEPLVAVITPTPTTPTPTPTATTTSPGGGTSGGSSSSGGGGGGVTSGEPFGNILRSEKRDGTLIANKPAIFSYTTPDAIHQIAVIGTENENDVSIRVETLKDTSKLVAKPAPGTVHINENVWANSKKIKEVTIRFRVEKDWIMSNGVKKEDIRLLRWQDNDWKQLETKVLSSDDVYSYFESSSPGFSSFAISALKSETSLAATTAVAPGAATPAKTPSVTSAGPQTGQAISWVYIIILIAVIAVVAYLYTATRKKK